MTSCGLKKTSKICLFGILDGIVAETRDVSVKIAFLFFFMLLSFKSGSFPPSHCRCGYDVFDQSGV